MGVFFNAMEEWTRLMNELELAKKDRIKENELNKKLTDQLGVLFDTVTKREDREDELVFELAKRLDKAEAKVRELTEAIERNQ